VAEHVASALYFLQVHLLVATVVALAAWALSSLLRASDSVKFWIWTAASLNFVLPLAGFIDRFGAADFPGARQLPPLAHLDLGLARQLPLVSALAALWLGAALLLLLRLALRIRAERRMQRPLRARDCPHFRMQGVPVHWTAAQFGPAVEGMVRSWICLPRSVEQLLSARELEAILLHEVTHAKRHDNLLRLLQELAQCLLWFHPLVWLAGARLALYRELSCDEAALRHGSGDSLIAALAKLASPERSLLLHSAATALMPQRLERLLAPTAPDSQRLSNALLTAAFVAILTAGMLFTLAHTACCLIPLR
jgi:beta-lactamase regulating signal transducer with metallopeptidase domain